MKSQAWVAAAIAVFGALAFSQISHASYSPIESKKVSQWVMDRVAHEGSAAILIKVKGEADFSKMPAGLSRIAKTTLVYQQLKKLSQESQASLAARLSELNIKYRRFLVGNLIYVKEASADLIRELQLRSINTVD